jgi:hypothetical protein
MDTINIPVSPDTATVTLQTGGRFAVAGGAIWLNIGTSPREILVGNYQWVMAGGAFTAYSLTSPATVWICVTQSTASATPTPTVGPTAPVGACLCVIVAPVVAPTVVGGLMPDLGLHLPTARPTNTPTLTTTSQISIMVAVEAIGTLQAGLTTPAALVSTVSARYSYRGGVQTAATVTANMEPALGWLGLVNPMHPAWQATGGPLWAVAPLLWPISPILLLLSSVVVWRVAITLWNWLLALANIVVKLIELIPGE